MKKIIYYIRTILYLVTFYQYYRLRFGKFGKRTRMRQPLAIDGWENIEIGDKVKINYKVWLAAIPHTEAQQCRLLIGNGSIIGNFNHIYATESIEIGSYVLTADKVYISDNLHGYEDINVPILSQSIIQKHTVKIGDNSWLGENVCIIGASVGKHCVIGANSVVTSDIPDYSVAVGAPAKVIRQYNHGTKTWERIQ